MAAFGTTITTVNNIVDNNFYGNNTWTMVAFATNTIVSHTISPREICHAGHAVLAMASYV